jgi:BirA family transcriptional regulator, biotin operon repressor / biotin---[acetyl-CoA-carboxylase] ligase
MARLVTDSREAAGLLLPGVDAAAPTLQWRSITADPTVEALFPAGAVLLEAQVAVAGWTTVLVRDFATESQFDAVVQLARSGQPVADRTAVLARHGTGFHGTGGRRWMAVPGNIHLTAHLAPQRPIRGFDSVFTALGAVACIEAIDTIACVRGRARIKWVNDVLLDGCKLGGVIAFTQVQGEHVVGVTVGIGLNIEAVPDVERTPDVPAVAALGSYTPVRCAEVCGALLHALARAYDTLLHDGTAPLLARYRERSAVLGEDVVVREERSGDVVAEGRVVRIGDALELYIDGRAEPVRSGRLTLGRAAGIA